MEALWLGPITVSLVLSVSLLNSGDHKVKYFGIDGDAYKFGDKKGSGQMVQGAGLLFLRDQSNALRPKAERG